MKKLTEDERALLIEVMETSTFAGKIARFVADLLDKLREG